MAVSCCSNGLLLSTLAALLSLPLHYYIPSVVHDLRFGRVTPQPIGDDVSALVWIDNAVAQFPILNVLATISLLLIELIFYVFDGIQRKITEWRLSKLKQQLTTSLERLRVWDIRSQILDNTRKMVQNATSEYNIVLLLSQKKYVGEHSESCSETVFENIFPDIPESLKLV